MSVRLHLKYFFTALVFLLSIKAYADGGIIIQGTRLIYPLNDNQLTLSLSNTSNKDTFLVQSWVENKEGRKTKDILVVPPLYLSGPKDENLIRLMLLKKNLPTDRETLYYFVTKSIPPINKSDLNQNVVRIALASRIKLFVRPAGLQPSSQDAQNDLKFSRKRSGLIIDNPTPYYITIVNLVYGAMKLDSIMISPFSKKTVPCDSVKSMHVSFSTVNDYGAMTKTKNIILK